MNKIEKKQVVKERSNYIDIARGIALFLVVLGHILQINSKEFNWIFSFHMPLFFVISGMCYELKEQPKFGKYLLRKIKTLVIPYILFSALGFLISYSVDIWKAGATSEGAFKLAFYYTQPELFHVGQVWFLMALFISSIFLYILHKLIIDKQKDDTNKNIINVALIVLFIYLGTSINKFITIEQYGRLPWKIDVAFMATAFMLFGCLIKRNNILEKIKSKWVMSIILMIVLGRLNYLYGPLRNGYVNICDCVYGIDVLWYYISAICGSMVILIFSNLISKNKVLEYYGRNSLFMFAIHSMYLYQTQYILSKIYNTNYYIMNNIPIKLCLISALAIYILLVPITIIYNFGMKNLKKLVKNIKNKNSI